jgi:hypothetical protein
MEKQRAARRDLTADKDKKEEPNWLERKPTFSTLSRILICMIYRMFIFNLILVVAEPKRRRNCIQKNYEGSIRADA